MKKIIKSLFALVLVVAVLFEGRGIYFAAETNVKNIVVESISDKGIILEKKTLNEGVVRTYKSHMGEKKLSDEEIKNILYTLGLEERYIEKMTEEDIKECREASEIFASVAYLEIDSNGEICYLNENEALERASLVNETRENRILNQMNGIMPAENDSVENAYMKLSYFVVKVGTDCTSSVWSKWLTMPAVRSYDSIGACAEYITVTPDSASCTITYDTYTTIGGVTTKTSGNTVSASIDEAEHTNGWSGAAAVFNLPDDTVTTDFTRVHSNFEVWFEYRGHIKHPDERLYFNAMASYRHATVAVAIQPGISIGTSDGDISIGMSLVPFKDEMKVPLEIEYIP